ncbi:hypothetical protein CL634_01910 [bacterium]|nr:hypothetical protein [bacterium]|tara:strand:- start:2432 stop:2941 length:510 start_codon:yes stop_codon:yes gene_type:complete
MPFASSAELPDKVKSKLPTKAQTIFRRAFNASSKKNPDFSEEKLFKIAWGAVKNAGYSKGDNGKWIKTSLDIELEITDYSWVDKVYHLSCSVPVSEFQESNVDQWEITSPYIITNIIEENDNYIFSLLSLDAPEYRAQYTRYTQYNLSDDKVSRDCTIKLATKLTLTID